MVDNLQAVILASNQPRHGHQRTRCLDSNSRMAGRTSFGTLGPRRSIHGSLWRIGSNGKSQTKSFPDADSSRRRRLYPREARQGLQRSRVCLLDLRHGARSHQRRNVAAGWTDGEALFWDLIRFNWKRRGDDDAVLRPVVTALSRMAVEDILAFDDILAKLLFALDTREICRAN